MHRQLTIFQVNIPENHLLYLIYYEPGKDAHGKQLPEESRDNKNEGDERVIRGNLNGCGK